jgi:hypothetical protein
MLRLLASPDLRLWTYLRLLDVQVAAAMSLLPSTFAALGRLLDRQSAERSRSAAGGE